MSWNRLKSLSWSCTNKRNEADVQSCTKKINEAEDMHTFKTLNS